MKFADINKEEFERLFLSNPKIVLSEIYGVSKHSVYVWSKRLGIHSKITPSNKALKSKVWWSADEIKLLRHWADTPSLSIDYICTVLNRTEESIRSKCNYEKIRIRIRGKDGQYKFIDNRR